MPIGAQFSAGQLKDQENKWRSLTNDPVILDATMLYHIESVDGLPTKICEPKQIFFQLLTVR